jgi:dUTP pyrophosphatase
MKICKVRDVKTPTRGTEGSAGLDFYVPNDLGHEEIVIGPGSAAFSPSGIKADVPAGHALIAFNKSGVALKKQLSVGACVVDEDYQGEIHLHVYNFGNEETLVKPGEKLLQMVLLPVNYASVEVVEEDQLFGETTERGDGGFGSTGVF